MPTLKRIENRCWTVGSINGRSWQREQRDDLSLSEVLYVLWERRWLVAGAVLVLALATALFIVFHEPVYTAEASVIVQPREELSGSEESAAFMEEMSVVATDELLRNVRREAGWEGAPKEFEDRLDPQPFPTGEGGYRLRVRFSGSEPEEAVRAANAYATLFVQRIERLNDERLAGGTLAADASVEHRAAPPGNWLKLRPLLFALAAIGTGVVLGGAAALLIEGRAHSWRDARDAELTLRAPVLGVIPDYSSVERED
jgi:capsular polysaccharide biosynthesis protein